MTVNTQVEKPPFVIGGKWNRFIEVAVHPKTPLVGMLHATFSMQVSDKGDGNIGATMDMMQAAQSPEDLALFDARVTEVFAKYGMDREKYRGKGCKQAREGPWKYYRPGTCTGVSMYGPDLLADEKHFALVSELYGTVVDTYFELLEKRKSQRYGAAELAAQDAMRRGLAGGPVVLGRAGEELRALRSLGGGQRPAGRQVLSGRSGLVATGKSPVGLATTGKSQSDADTLLHANGPCRD